MGQHYSNPQRANDPHALPDVETFELESVRHCEECIAVDGQNSGRCSGGECLAPGWYWWMCFPGCLPDGEPNGSFETEQLAVEDAQSATDDEWPDEIGDDAPPCIRAMGCHCAGHARGNAADEPCDTSEEAPDDEQDLDDDEPGEEDYYLSDDERSIMYLGKRIVGPVAADSEPCCQDAAMARLRNNMLSESVKYYPNVWKISDHGNATLISVLECGCYFTEHGGEAALHKG